MSSMWYDTPANPFAARPRRKSRVIAGVTVHPPITGYGPIGGPDVEAAQMVVRGADPTDTRHDLDALAHCLELRGCVIWKRTDPDPAPYDRLLAARRDGSLTVTPYAAAVDALEGWVEGYLGACRASLRTVEEATP